MSVSVLRKKWKIVLGRNGYYVLVAIHLYNCNHDPKFEKHTQLMKRPPQSILHNIQANRMLQLIYVLPLHSKFKYSQYVPSSGHMAEYGAESGNSPTSDSYMNIIDDENLKIHNLLSTSFLK